MTKKGKPLAPLRSMSLHFRHDATNGHKEKFLALCRRLNYHGTITSDETYNHVKVENLTATEYRNLTATWASLTIEYAGANKHAGQRRLL